MAALMRTMAGGAVILIIPAFVICAGIAITAYRKRGPAPKD